MKNPTKSLPLVIVGAIWAGCVDPSHSSRIFLELYTGFGPASAVSIDGDNTVRRNPHYVLWGTVRNDAVAQLKSFQISAGVDTLSPCLMYDSIAAQALPGVRAGEAIMEALPDGDPPALRSQKMWLQNRIQALATTVFAITSTSDGFPGHTQLDLSRCQGNLCWLDHAAIVPNSLSLFRNNTALMQEVCSGSAAPAAGHYCAELSSGRITLSDADLADPAATITADYSAHMVSPKPQTDPLSWSDADRLRACGSARVAKISGADNPAYDPDFYVGNALELTAPENGLFFAVVDGFDPSGAPRGGGTVDVSFALTDLTELFVTVEDRSVGSPNSKVENQVDPLHRGPLVVDGFTARNQVNMERGVDSLILVAPSNVTIGGKVPGGRAAILVSPTDSVSQF